MRFGKFLTERGVVCAADVLSGLAEQARRRKYLPIMLAEAGVVTAESALERDDSILRNDEELLVDSYRRGLLSARHYHHLETAWRLSAPPIGEILVERELLSTIELNSYLAEFHAPALHGAKNRIAMRSRGPQIDFRRILEPN
jgi:hypothetical protein